MDESKNNESILKIDKDYLNNLIEETNIARREYMFDSCCKEGCSVSYLPTKDIAFAGLCAGYNQELILKNAGLFEKPSIKANCKNYCEIYRDKNGKIKMITCFKDGRVDCVFQAYYKGDKRYLFPFFENGDDYSMYSFVSKTKGDEVVESYHVGYGQIAYEGYSNKTENGVDYYFVNYVPKGSYPVREQVVGRFSFDPPKLEIKLNYIWLEELRKQKNN